MLDEQWGLYLEFNTFPHVIHTKMEILKMSASYINKLTSDF